MKASKIEIRQVNGEKGIFTEILVDGHKLEGVRSFELKQGVGDSVPVLSIDLNALNLSTDLQTLQVNQKGIGEIESIKFNGQEMPVEFGIRDEIFKEATHTGKLGEKTISECVASGINSAVQNSIRDIDEED
uniref:hypothetical protein n=1 Tax=Phocaeicola vulgatus TaxID=821 RepID=UPI003FF0DB92